MNFEHIIVTPNYDEHIALIQLNRPKALNALIEAATTSRFRQRSERVRGR